MRADQVAAAWNILMPIINAWKTNITSHFPNYPAGMEGPEDTETLIAKDSNNWIVMPLGKNGKD
jgi:glucose-6-phosphate 1-dehydrogenase